MNTQKTIWTIIILAILAVGVYMYATRPLKITQVDTVATSTSETTVVVSTSTTSTTSTTVKSYSIDSTQSLATYTLGELLNGKPKTVIGTTSAISGEVIVDISNSKNATMTAIKIDARTFKTDSEKRDNAVARFVLQSEKTEFAFITFTPTDISGSPETIVPGQEYSFKVKGDLSIAGITKSETFDVKARLSADGSTISGTASSTIKRSDYKLTIPNIPFVANVDQDVKLAFSFVLKSK